MLSLLTRIYFIFCNVFRLENANRELIFSTSKCVYIQLEGACTQNLFELQLSVIVNRLCKSSF